MPMDLQRILSQLHDERRLVNDVIAVLERLSAGLGKRGSLARAAASLINEEKEANPAPRKRGRPRKNPAA
jgi:hypothetical protein